MDTKRKLQFRKDGTFRVLMMSDLQESSQYDPRSLRSVEAVLDEGDPDLVILGGDNCNGPEIKNEQDLRDFLDIFTAPMEKRGIPWAHVYGNHDHDAPVDISRQQEIYESYSFCVSGHTDDSVHGKSNFLLPVYNSKDEIALAVWGLDTNHTVDELDFLVNGKMDEMAGLPNCPVGYGVWGMLYFDQLLWYYNTSLQLEKTMGRKVPGLLCMHIAPYEYLTACANPEICVREGDFSEGLGTMPFNPGLFALLLQRGDIRAICCGHTHRNDFDAEYCGIRLLWDACVGYRCYGVDERRGGRLFVYREDDPTKVNTSMIRSLPKIIGDLNL
ncbi:MAG: hypothetical protein E7638_07300 [Ruminococcaceae bacterium]|nr:hypothetical protein [Oscillospiraceae bacterium]